MAQKNKVKELVGRGLNSYHTKALQQMDRIEKKNKEQNHKISILSNELDNDYLTKTEEGSVISLEHSKEGMVYLDELQGNTLVNYCTDGSKEMTLNGDIDVEGTFVTTTEGADNGKVDVLCEGNTLVNLSVTKEKLNQTNPHYSDVYLCETERIKPNTTYTLSYDFECNINFPIERCYLGYGSGKSSMRVESGVKFNPIIGRNKLVFTISSSELERVKADGDIYFFVRVHIDSDKREKTFSTKNVMLLEGDWSNKEIPTHFEGMKSVGEIEGNKIEILSQIIGDLTLETEQGDINITSGENANNNRRIRAKNFTEVKPNTTYKLERSIVSGNMGIRFYDINKNYISNSSVHTNLGILNFTTPNNCKYIKFIDESNNLNSIHKLLSVTISSNKKEILMNEPLRGLPSNDNDKIVKIGGKYYIERNVNEVEINSLEGLGSVSEPLTTNNVTTSRVYIAYEQVTALLPNIRRNIGTGDIMCDKLPYKTVVPNIQQENQMAIGKTGAGVSLRLNGSNIEECESWLNNNPLKISYALATPVYEPLEIEPTLNTYNDITHISNNSIIPCTMKIKNTGYNAIIKPSTLYTVALDTNKSGTIGMNLGGAKVTTTNNVATITTPATLSDDSLRLYGKGIKASKVRLLEGDKTNWIPSHFEGMKSSFEDKLQEDGTYKMEISSKNKNLFTHKEYIPVNGLSVETPNDNTVILKDATPNNYKQLYLWIRGLKANVNYIVTSDVNAINGIPLIALQDAKTTNDAFISKTESRNRATFKLKQGHDTVKLRLFVNHQGGDIAGHIEYKNIQIREETTSETYEETKSNKIQFSSIEPLRSAGNIKDKFIFKDGQLMIERNLNKVKLTRNHVRHFTSGSDGYMSANYCAILLNLNDEHPSKRGMGMELLCNQLPSTKNDIWTGTVHREGISGVSDAWDFSIKLSNTKTGLTLNDKDNTSKVLDAFKEYLDNNVLEVIYHMKEPIYEEIPFELQKIILEGYENGTLFFDTNIPPTSTVTYAGETPIVKSVKLNKTEVLNNTEDINDNIIPYLMDMDYRVVCLQLATEEIEGGVSMARLFGGAYEMLKRDILSKRLSRQEYGYRLADYFNAGKLTEEQVRELEDLR